MCEQILVTGKLSEKLKKLTFLVDPENQPHQGYPLEDWRNLSDSAARLETDLAEARCELERLELEYRE